MWLRLLRLPLSGNFLFLNTLVNLNSRLNWLLLLLLLNLLTLMLLEIGNLYIRPLYFPIGPRPTKRLRTLILLHFWFLFLFSQNELIFFSFQFEKTGFHSGFFVFHHEVHVVDQEFEV